MMLANIGTAIERLTSYRAALEADPEYQPNAEERRWLAWCRIVCIHLA